MKRILFALLCVACTGNAWAQGPLPQPSVTVTVQQATPLQQATGGRSFAAYMPPCDSACTPCCQQPCCMATKTICVSEPATKVTVKFLYSSVCEKVCYPKCSIFSHCNSCCDQGNCDSHIYQKKYLIKRVCTTECPTTKCVPVEVPACETRGGFLHNRAGGASVAPIYVDPAPLPPAKR